MIELYLKLPEIYIDNGGETQEREIYQRIELNSDESIEYTRQINDITSVETQETSYTNTFKVPKTKSNRKLMKSLGSRGSISRAPYTKTPARLIVDGVEILNDGWAVVEDSDDKSYSLHVFEGIIDFFKAIEDKTLGKNLDMKELVDHVRDIDTVVKSFSGKNSSGKAIDYKYALADFGGKTHYTYKENENDEEGIKGINIDYMVPFISVKALWDKVFKKVGYKYECRIFEDEDTSPIKDLWISYPMPPNSQEEEKEYSKARVVQGDYDLLLSGGEKLKDALENTNYMVVDMKESEPNHLGSDGWSHLSDEEGGYVVYVKGAPRMETKKIIGNKLEYYNLGYIVYLNEKEIGRSEPVIGIENGQFIEQKRIRLVSEAEGDKISVKFYTNTGDISLKELNHAKLSFYNTDIFVKKDAAGFIDSEEAFGDFSFEDFIKEITNRFGLTMVPDNENRTIYFYTLSQIMNKEEGIDLSEYYMERTKEEYVIDDYAKKNWFRYKYNDENAQYYDGYLRVPNANLEEEEDMFESICYAPEKRKVKFWVNNNKNEEQIYTYKLWEAEAKDEDGEVKVDYSGLSDRFYLAELKPFSNTAEKTTFVSEYLKDQKPQENNPVKPNEERLYYADFDKLKYSKEQDLKKTREDDPGLISGYFSPMSSMLTRIKIHTIKMNMPLVKFASMKLYKLYYFQQEGAWYLLNELNLKKKEVEGTFVRVEI